MLKRNKPECNFKERYKYINLNVILKRDINLDIMLKSDIKLDIILKRDEKLKL